MKTLSSLNRFVSEAKQIINGAGLMAKGQVISVSVFKQRYNNLMEFIVDGQSILPKLKSADSIKDEYDEKDHDQIDKMYTQISETYSKEIEKLVVKFEKDLNNVISSMEKTINKTF